jgi:hypothetical protein
MIALVMVVAGTTLAPIQSYAAQQKVRGTEADFPDISSLKHSIRDGVSVNLEHRDQHMNQENLCYRTNTCRQSDVGQNTLGNDNSVTGFADQSDNLQQAATAPGNNTTPTPTPRTCEECFTSKLTAGQLANVVSSFGFQNLTALCENLTAIAPLNTETTFRTLLSTADPSITTTIANDLIACLRTVGIVFSGP